METKDTNPKDAVGTAKVPVSVVPSRVVAEVGLAMFEGARKYGRHNYRDAGVRASVYFDATMRHGFAWWEGQDVDPDSGLSHITKMIAGLMVLRDSMMQGNWTDDRPPKAEDAEEWVAEMNAKAKEIIERYPDAKPAHTELGQKPSSVSAFPADPKKIGHETATDAEGGRRYNLPIQLKSEDRAWVHCPGCGDAFITSEASPICAGCLRTEAPAP